LLLETQRNKMADIAVAGLTICPDVVMPAADRQMLNRTIANLVGIPSAKRRAGNDPLWIAFGEMSTQSYLGNGRRHHEPQSTTNTCCASSCSHSNHVETKDSHHCIALD